MRLQESQIDKARQHTRRAQHTTSDTAVSRFRGYGGDSASNALGRAVFMSRSRRRRLETPPRCSTRQPRRVARPRPRPEPIPIQCRRLLVATADPGAASPTRLTTSWAKWPPRDLRCLRPHSWLHLSVPILRFARIAGGMESARSVASVSADIAFKL